MSPSNKNGPFEGPQNGYKNDNAPLRSASPPKSAILIRKLPHHTTKEELNSMLLFTQDLISISFVDSHDLGYSSASATFHTEARAWEAQAMLHGKPNSTRDATMIVEVLSPNSNEPTRRRATLEQSAMSADIKKLAAAGPWGSSRYNDTFQPLDRVSPSTKSGMTNGDSLKSDSTQGQGYFSPQSVGTSISGQSNTGKSVIGQDMDDETGKLLDDPVAFMRNDPQSMNYGATSQGRRSTLPHIPTGRFANMSLNTSGMSSPQSSGVVSPRMGPLQSPTGFATSNMASMGPNASYQYTGPTYMRPNMPPVNPSDQNPPCNTLYVGNLPMDAAEDELKALFCKQRGYKRLCLRTKNNGPMCFVEFEDITCASKALTECYGAPLHNSTKGGIRLSFSKNPLGVRNGQPGSMNGASPLSSHGPISGVNGMPSYSTVNGPPPGLNPPPGLAGVGVNGTATGMSMASPNGSAVSSPFSNSMSPVSSSLGPTARPSSSAIGQGWNWPTREVRTADVPASMMGR